jgi:riboflavin kinase
MLSYNYCKEILLFAEGKVKCGYGRGSRKLGFPTANLPDFEHQLNESKLKNGVYSGWMMLEGSNRWRSCVTNIGLSPTFVGEENRHRIIESHIYESDNLPSDFYDRYIRVLLTSYLRPELKFNGIDELKASINKDIETSRMVNKDLLGGGHTVDPAFLQVILENIASQPFGHQVLVSSEKQEEHKRWQNIDWDIKEEA